MRSVRSTGSARLVAGAAVVVALSLAASACGGSSNSETTTTSTATAMATWASAVCTSFSSWKASLQRDKAAVSSNPTTDEFQNSTHQAVLATQGLQSSLQQLGKPPTGNSATVQKEIASLRTDLLNGKQKIENTLEGSNSSKSEMKSDVATVRTTVNGMLDSFSSTVDNLQSLDPSSEVSKAFHSTVACEPYFK
jgi:exonuclease VII large subunit